MGRFPRRIRRVLDISEQGNSAPAQSNTPTMRPLNNSAIPGKVAKASELGSDEYSARVATPIMNAVDKMPRDYRELVNEFGYIDVYHAWRRGLSPAQIRQSAKDGFFKLF